MSDGSQIKIQLFNLIFHINFTLNKMLGNIISTTTSAMQCNATSYQTTQPKQLKSNEKIRSNKSQTFFPLRSIFFQRLTFSLLKAHNFVKKFIIPLSYTKLKDLTISTLPNLAICQTIPCELNLSLTVVQVILANWEFKQFNSVQYDPDLW